MDRPLNILAVTRKPNAASYQQRVRNWIEPLQGRGIEITERVWPSQRSARRSLIAELAGADGVWWQRNLLNSLQARRVRRAARKWVIDYDDPLCYSSKNGGRKSWTRQRRFAATLRHVDAVLTSSQTLAGLARPYCQQVEIVPMAVDPPAAELLERHPRPGREKPLLLWLGSKATQPYLQPIEPALRKLKDRVTMQIVGGDHIDWAGLPIEHQTWSPETEQQALLTADVGLCPMPDTLWTRGKCPYKVLQYMSYGLPWVGSDVGENRFVAADGKHGLTAKTTEAWVDALDQFIADRERRLAMGQAGREYIQQTHSRDTLLDRLEKFWRQLLT
jgi:glycosyltransferase involved in cell wall biosynthesis